MRRPLLLLVTTAVVLLATGCGGGSGKAGAPKQLLQPAKLDATAPALFRVAFKTTKGTFVVTVHRAWAPRGATRFYNLVKASFYDGDSFFRVLPHFVVQFGISPYPAVSKAWIDTTIPDDPHRESNTRGTISFASAGANTRTTQVFVNLGDNTRLDALGFTPFGRVTSGLAVLGKLYSGYGERLSSLQPQIQAGGSKFLANYPRLDRIVTARVTG
jgi:peptidyl-prolyl cis-trans isomerase A (cyclophilin A)